MCPLLQNTQGVLSTVIEVTKLYVFVHVCVPRVCACARVGSCVRA